MAAEKFVVDVGLPASWPHDLKSIVAKLDRITPSSAHVADLALSPAAEDRILDTLKGQNLQAHHFTRLLPHEAEMILDTGLRLHSRELFDQRIEAAYENGYLAAATAESLKASSIPAAEAGRRGNRNFVWMTTGCMLEEGRTSIAPLLCSWGGEGIYFSAGALPYSSLLRSMGRPAMVEVHLSLDSPESLTFYPALGRLFLGAFRGLDGVMGDISSRDEVAASALGEIHFLD